MKYILKGLDCPACGAKIEKKLDKLDHNNEININFNNNTVELDPDLENQAQKIIDNIEPGVKLVPWKDEEGKVHIEPQNYDHENDFDMKIEMFKIGISLVFLVFGFIFRDQLQNTPAAIADYAVFLFAYILVGGNVIISAGKNIIRGDIFNEKFLMSVATVGAILIQELPEAVAVMLFYSVGELFQDFAVNRSRKSISSLLDLRPEFANLLTEYGVETVSPEQVKSGDIITVNPGERIPLDGQVIAGESFVNTSALTGESVPESIGPGEQVLSGSINENSLLKIEVTKEYSNSAVAKIFELVEEASERKAPTEKFITTFAGYYTPVVVGGALLLATIPPLFISGAEFSEWIYRALILLVISCPCALVLSIPLGYFGGVGGASRGGVLVKGANYLDALLKTTTVVFDKTGTLTEGVFKVIKVVTKNGFTENDLLKYASIAEGNSNHPIARSILDESQNRGIADLRDISVANQQEYKGFGIKCELSNGKLILAGNAKLLTKEDITVDSIDNGDQGKTIVHVAIDGEHAGYLILDDEIKANAEQTVANLKAKGIEKIIMLTGDEEETAKRIATQLRLDSYYAGLLPEQKIEIVDQLISQQSDNEKLIFIGDGINDAPVITRSDVGFAMGALGSDAAIDASDVVLMDDNLNKIPFSLDIARKTRRIVLQNISFALGIKAVFMLLGAMGMATMWGAIFADVGVAILAVFNSTRTLSASSKFKI